MPSRLKDEKPVSVNVTVYVQGMSSMMRYSPRSSVTALRTFSMRTGLDASTVTPGSTAPDVSVTTPAMVAELVPCAGTGAELKIRNAVAQRPRHVMRHMEAPFRTKRSPKDGMNRGRRTLRNGLLIHLQHSLSDCETISGVNSANRSIQIAG